MAEVCAWRLKNHPDKNILILQKETSNIAHEILQKSLSSMETPVSANFQNYLQNQLSFNEDKKGYVKFKSNLSRL